MTAESILIVTRNYPPLTGGMERLMHETLAELADGSDVTLIGPRGSSQHVPDGVRVLECPASAGGFLMFAMVRGLVHCLFNRYRLVVGGSGLVAPVTALLARLCGGASVLFVHGLDLVADSAIYQRWFVAAIRRHDLIIANSANTRDIAVSKGCRPDTIRILHPGTVIPEDDFIADRESHRRSLGIGAEPTALFVGRIIRRKGLAPFLASAWPGIVAAEPDARLLVVGDTPADALNRDPGHAPDLTAQLAEAGLAESVRFMGPVDDESLWRCYAAADVLVFPLVEVSGDVEGFGMVAVEAAACGTPTVAFPVGGVGDAVVDGVSGRLVPDQDYAAFAEATIQVLRGQGSTRSGCREHALGFGWERHKAKLLAILNAVDTVP